MVLKKIIYNLAKRMIFVFKVTPWLMPIYRWGMLCLLKWMGIKIIGKPRYISNDCYFDGVDYSLITICDEAVISKEVVILTHDYSITRVFKSFGEKLKTDVRIVKPVFIGKNSFIGYRSILMPGAYIGENVIVGAGSVVRGRIPKNSIAFGNPAKVLNNTKEVYKKYIEDYKNNKLQVDR